MHDHRELAHVLGGNLGAGGASLIRVIGDQRKVTLPGLHVNLYAQGFERLDVFGSEFTGNETGGGLLGCVMGKAPVMLHDGGAFIPGFDDADGVIMARGQVRLLVEGLDGLEQRGLTDVGNSPTVNFVKPLAQGLPSCRGQLARLVSLLGAFHPATEPGIVGCVE